MNFDLEALLTVAATRSGMHYVCAEVTRFLAGASAHQKAVFKETVDAACTDVETTAAPCALFEPLGGWPNICCHCGTDRSRHDTFAALVGVADTNTP